MVPVRSGSPEVLFGSLWSVGSTGRVPVSPAGVVGGRGVRPRTCAPPTRPDGAWGRRSARGARSRKPLGRASKCLHPAQQLRAPGIHIHFLSQFPGENVARVVVGPLPQFPAHCLEIPVCLQGYRHRILAAVVDQPGSPSATRPGLAAGGPATVVRSGRRWGAADGAKRPVAVVRGPQEARLALRLSIFRASTEQAGSRAWKSVVCGG